METFACASTSLCFEAYNVNKLRKSQLLKKLLVASTIQRKRKLKIYMRVTTPITVRARS